MSHHSEQDGPLIRKILRSDMEQTLVTNSKSSRHVVRRPEGWAVVNPGAERASAILRTQAEAIRRARLIVQNDGGGEVVVHDRHGRIRDSDTVAPGNDPFPPKDTK